MIDHRRLIERDRIIANQLTEIIDFVEIDAEFRDGFEIVDRIDLMNQNCQLMVFIVEKRKVLKDFREILVGRSELRIFERECFEEIAQFVDSCSR